VLTPKVTEVKRGFAHGLTVVARVGVVSIAMWAPLRMGGIATSQSLGDRHAEAHPDDHAFASASRDRLVRLDQRLHGGVCALRNKTALKRDGR